jgi:hypothetical protein
MSTVDHGQHTASARGSTQLLDGQDGPGRGHDVAEEEQLCMWTQGRPRSLHDLVRLSGQHRQIQDPNVESLPLSRALPAPPHGEILVVGQNDLPRRVQYQTGGPAD